MHADFHHQTMQISWPCLDMPMQHSETYTQLLRIINSWSTCSGLLYAQIIKGLHYTTAHSWTKMCISVAARIFINRRKACRGHASIVFAFRLHYQSLASPKIKRHCIYAKYL